MVWSNYKSLTSLEQVNILTSLFLTHHSCHFQTFKKSKLGQKTGSGRTIRVHQLGPSLQTPCLQNFWASLYNYKLKHNLIELFSRPIWFLNSWTTTLPNLWSFCGWPTITWRITLTVQNVRKRFCATWTSGWSRHRLEDPGISKPELPKRSPFLHLGNNLKFQICTKYAKNGV